MTGAELALSGRPVDVTAAEESIGVVLAGTDAMVELGAADELGIALVVPFVVTLYTAIFSAAYRLS